MFEALIGNTQAPLATPEELNCAKCGRFDCRCGKPAAKPMRDICPACHRDRMQQECLCASEIPTVELGAAEAEAAEVQAKLLTGRARVEATIMEFRYCWHDSRDAARVERMLRELAEKVYLA